MFRTHRRTKSLLAGRIAQLEPNCRIRFRSNLASLLSSRCGHSPDPQPQPHAAINRTHTHDAVCTMAANPTVDVQVRVSKLVAGRFQDRQDKHINVQYNTTNWKSINQRRTSRFEMSCDPRTVGAGGHIENTSRIQ